MKSSLYVSDNKKKRKKRRKYFLGVVAILAFYFVLYATQWFFFHSPLFRVDNVVVKGNSSVASADVVSLVQSDALKNHETFPAVFGFNNMLAWPSNIASSNIQVIPQLESVSINKDYFAHTLTINVSERIPFGIWCFSSGSDCFWFDNTGTLFERSLDTQGNLIFDVQDYSQSPRGLNEKVLPDQYVQNFISIMNVLRQSGLGVKEIDLNNLSLEEVDVITTNGPKLYFSLRFSADDYLQYIQKLMAQPGFDKIGYIDCRTEDRIYYK
jgi:cell division septal protein FtsQ